MLALIITVIWLGLAYLYISNNISWYALGRLPAEQMGSFLEGAFAPLAFLWLVVGYFLQQKELEQNTKALQAQAKQIGLTAKEASIQSEKLAASELHARQDAIIQLEHAVRVQLGGIAGFLFISSQSADQDGEVSAAEVSQLFSLQTSTDHEIFTRRMLQVHIQISDSKGRYDLFYGTLIRARHTNNFIFTYERLLARVVDAGNDEILIDAITHSANGMLYRAMLGYQAEAPENWNHHSKTGRFIEFE